MTIHGRGQRPPRPGSAGLRDSPERLFPHQSRCSAVTPHVLLPHSVFFLHSPCTYKNAGTPRRVKQPQGGLFSRRRVFQFFTPLQACTASSFPAEAIFLTVRFTLFFLWFFPAPIVHSPLAARVKRILCSLANDFSEATHHPAGGSRTPALSASVFVRRRRGFRSERTGSFSSAIDPSSRHPISFDAQRTYSPSQTLPGPETDVWVSRCCSNVSIQLFPSFFRIASLFTY